MIAFARLSELLGSERGVSLDDGATVGDLWRCLAQSVPAIEPLRASTRAARNGRIVSADEPLAAGDELALLPPVGGG